MNFNNNVPKCKKTVFLISVSIALCSSAVVASDFSDWISPEVVGAPVGTSGNEGCQFVTSDGLTMYFASGRASPGTPLGQNDLFVATRNSAEENFGNIERLAGLGSSSQDICPTVSPDGKYFYFVSDRSGDDQCGGSDIFMATRTGDGPADWGNPVRLGCDINSPAAEEGPQFFVNPEDNDDITLYFSSNRSSTEYSGYNIFMLTKFKPAKGTSHSKVELMPGVNTDKNDRRGTIREDGLEIIIESNRTGSSFSGSNLWQLTRESINDSFSNPVPIESLNSNGNEFRPTLVGKGNDIYFMSDRPIEEGGIGGNDIWHALRTGGTDSEN